MLSRAVPGDPIVPLPLRRGSTFRRQVQCSRLVDDGDVLVQVRDMSDVLLTDFLNVVHSVLDPMKAVSERLDGAEKASKHIVEAMNFL